MSYENAWKEMVNIISNVKDSKIDDDLDTIIICVELLQKELNKKEVV